MPRNNNRANNNRANNNKANNNRSNNSRSSSSNNSKKGGMGMGGIALVVLAVLGLIGIYYYIQQSGPPEGFSNHNNANNASNNAGGDKLKPNNDEINMVLFFTEWCPHCQTFKPEWEKVKKQLEDTRINGKKINFHSVDCDKDEDLAKAYDVAGFPTVKCIKPDGVVEFDDSRDANAVVKFVRQQAGN